VEAESCPASVFDQFCLSFHPARMPLCPTKRGAVRSVCDSRSKFFRGCQYTQSSYLQKVLCITGDVARGGKALPLFPALSQTPCARQGVPSPSDLASERSFANEMSRRIKPARARVRRRRRASHVDDIARCGRWRMATTDGVDAKLVRPSIQRIGSVEAAPRTLPMSQLGYQRNCRT
jgi:hypothetical protein